MTILQYYCILGLTEIKKNCIPETKLCAKDAGCAGNKTLRVVVSYKRKFVQEVQLSQACPGIKVLLYIRGLI